MIISASRRTDIPAFYSQWFFNRLKAEFVLVRNPMNPRMVSRVSLLPDLLDGIVFWTKNPLPMMDKLNLLGDIPFYFLFTITPYDQQLERHIPPKDEIIKTFINLSKKIGNERVIWRYDPIVLNGDMDETFHLRQFKVIAEQLGPYTERCITSFLDMYQKCRRNLRHCNIRQPDNIEMLELAGELNVTAENNGIKMFTCAEPIDYTCAGIPTGKCIDESLFQRISGYRLKTRKDSSQRQKCLCCESIDIGAYNSCNHMCLYCYANADIETVKNQISSHHPDSPLLTGNLSGNEIITERKVRRLRIIERSLF